MVEDALPEPVLARLRAHWTAALTAAGAPGPHAVAGAGLLRRYDDPSRTYHGIAHLATVLRHIAELVEDDRIRMSIRDHADRATIELAAFFHDAIYDTDVRTGITNEEASARLAATELRRLGAPEPIGAEVARLVRLTATHDPAPGDHAGAVLCDADLAILAVPPTDYAAYTRAVRSEYAAVPDADFRAGRTKILATLLARPAIYRTPPGRDRWEAAARTNVAAEIERLRTPPSAPA